MWCTGAAGGVCEQHKDYSMGRACDSKYLNMGCGQHGWRVGGGASQRLLSGWGL